MQHWRDDLQWLADQCADANVIMAGDFNATLDHMSGLGVDGGTLGRCRRRGHRDRQRRRRHLVEPRSRPSLGAPIDHVMASSHWKPTGSLVLRSMDGSGSDHRPLIVQLEPAG